MKALNALFIVFALALIALLGTEAAGLTTLFGVVIPYVAIAVFLVGFTLKVLDWAKSPVPFRIPTTGGQQKSLDWIEHNKLDNPQTNFQTILRMALEVLTFRSLFRNTSVDKVGGQDDPLNVKVTYSSAKWLWLFALLFHYGFLTIVIRHLRFFTEPVPFFVEGLAALDGFLKIGQPVLMISDILIIAGLSFLFLRRLLVPGLRYISLVADYFPLFLILSIAGSGVVMRYFAKTDLTAVKELGMNLMTFNFTVPDGISGLFYAHLFLVSVLLMYFPFSKLMHLGGVFLSPTRNLPNNSRAVRHINPWNDPNVKPFSYEDYEDMFREKMHEAGLPLEKEYEPSEDENEA